MKIFPLAEVTLILLAANSSSAEVKNLFKESTPRGVEIQVTANDVQVIRRASQILTGESKWNRQDNRECPKAAKSFSLYCALFKASIEINGVFDHRLGAMEEVRRSVEAYSAGKNYEHRLMGYNNDPSTSFADIKRLLRTTEERIALRLKMMQRQASP